MDEKLRTQKNTIIFFNIEDAGRRDMGKNFKDWVDVLTAEYDYYAGVTYANDWTELNELTIEERLCPKKPFIIGGDYKLNNFYASNFPAFLSLNADIAKQIQYLPDGTPITYKVIKK